MTNEMPAFIMHDGELLDLLNDLGLADSILAAQAFDDLAGRWQTPRIRTWSRWWSWRLHTRLGDRPGYRQPEGTPASDLTREERDEVRRVFEHIAGAPGIGPALRTFARALTAQLIAIDLDADLDEQKATADLQAWIAERRRERPHGTPGDTGHLPSWSELSGPDDPAATARAVEEACRRADAHNDDAV